MLSLEPLSRVVPEGLPDSQVVEGRIVSGVCFPLTAVFFISFHLHLPSRDELTDTRSKTIVSVLL